MIEVRQTDHFAKWLRNLKDRRAVARIASRLERLEDGNFGDHKIFGEIGELRIDYGPGYRAYFIKRGNAVVILLCGGNKKTQTRDIGRARDMAKEL